MTLNQVLSFLFGWFRQSAFQVLDIVKNWPAVVPVGSIPSYSNLGFSLAGAMIAAIRGVSFHELLSHLLVSLNMTRSGLVSASAPSYLTPGFEGALPMPNFDFGFDNPAGGMYSTVSDMANFASFIFRNDAFVRDILSFCVRSVFLVVDERVVLSCLDRSWNASDGHGSSMGDVLARCLSTAISERKKRSRFG
jgi:CubicO group peptidase (beta-lactamase class C family)